MLHKADSQIMPDSLGGYREWLTVCTASVSPEQSGQFSKVREVEIGYRISSVCGLCLKSDAANLAMKSILTRRVSY